MQKRRPQEELFLQVQLRKHHRLDVYKRQGQEDMKESAILLLRSEEEMKLRLNSMKNLGFVAREYAKDIMTMRMMQLSLIHI